VQGFKIVGGPVPGVQKAIDELQKRQGREDGFRPAHGICPLKVRGACRRTRIGCAAVLVPESRTGASVGGSADGLRIGDLGHGDGRKLRPDGGVRERLFVNGGVLKPAVGEWNAA